MEFINDTTLNNIYNKLKPLLSGIKTVRDGYVILNKFNLTGDSRSLILNAIENKKYNIQIDIELLFFTIKEINLCKYREDAYNKLNHTLKLTNDCAQIKTLTRIANMKPLRPIIQHTQAQVHTNVHVHLQSNSKTYITKKCPHCNIACKRYSGSTYVICGYGTEQAGYDWDGCGRDWCFKCEKILCRQWENDQLFVQVNQIHDKNCCKVHSNITNTKKQYPEDYCQCESGCKCDNNILHVRRDLDACDVEKL